MMSKVRLWLPAAACAEAEAIISEVVLQWARDWFAVPEQISVSTTPATALRSLDWVGGAPALAGSEEGMTVRLGAALALGQADPGNPLDQAILVRLGEAAIAALAEMLGAPANHLPAGRSSVPYWAAHCYIVKSDQRDWSLGLVLGDEAMITMRRNRAGTGNSPRLGQISEALLGEPCQLSLHLGKARLDAADLAELCRGDVIMFDRPSSETLPLLVEGVEAAAGSARIESGNGALRVALTEAPSILAKENHIQ